jgi:hypothetical protein
LERVSEVRKTWQTARENDIERTLQRNFELDDEINTLRKSYHEKFKEVLPLKKVARLYAAEIEFQREVMQQLRRRREGRRP